MRKQNPKSYEYIESLMMPESALMGTARSHAKDLGLDAISVSQTEASILKFLIGANGCKKVVEIGTLTGLSALYILEALPADGRLWTLEKSAEHIEKASDVLAEEITKGRCVIVGGDALEKLPTLNSAGPFDAIFIDGNKAAYLKYFDWALENVSAGGLILVDNIFLAGAVWGDQTLQRFNEKQILNVQTMNKKAFTTEGLSTTIIPTSEGLLVCKKN
ncbi:MAG: O-methyltransferase [Bdellovibrio sp.]|nr:O-methyltransferase [Bdellovibrio sp.]